LGLEMEVSQHLYEITDTEASKLKRGGGGGGGNPRIKIKAVRDP